MGSSRWGSRDLGIIGDLGRGWGLKCVSLKSGTLVFEGTCVQDWL